MTTEHPPDNEKVRVALMSALAAVGLTGFKTAVGVYTGSLGIMAEAAHSGLDLVAALVTYFAVRVAGRPPDRDHTYGHGRVENLSALLETLLLLLTCVWIVYEATHRLMQGGVDIDPSPWAFVVMFTSIVIDYGRSRSLARAAKKYRSQALEADALHFSTDIWSSSVVILGLICVWIGEQLKATRPGWHDLVLADPIAALGVSAIVIYVSLRLGRKTVDSLLDRVPPELAGSVLEAAARVRGVMRATRARVREVGGRHFVDLVVEVDRLNAFERTEEISTDIAREVQSCLPDADVVVHPKPVASGYETAIEKVQVCAARLNQKVHNVVVFASGGAQCVNYHLEVSDDALLGDAWEIARKLEESIRAELPDAERINVHFDPRSAVVASLDLCDLDMQITAQRVREILLAHAEILDVHDLVVHQVGVRKADGLGVTDITCHCRMAADMPVHRIHELDDQIQNELRDRVGGLRYLFIQPEPAVS